MYMKKYMLSKKKKDTENGAVVIEATLSLTVFMFLIVTLLSIVNICIAQAKIGIALNQSAEEISQFLYFYSLSGLNDIQAKAYADSSGTRQQIEDLEEGITNGIETIQKFGSGGTSASDAISELKEDGSNIKDVAKEIAATEDKAAWIKSLVKVAGNEAFEVGKGYFAGALAEGLMRKHLTMNDEIDCDRNLKNMGVVDGMGGLNLTASSIYTNGTEDITLICTYDIKLLTLLNNDITFHFVQTAKTKAWGAQALVSGDVTKDTANAVSGKTVLVGAGAIDSGIAYSVADQLHVNVLAPTDTVWAYPDGSLVVGPDASTDSGEWVVVTPGSSPQNNAN